MDQLAILLLVLVILLFGGVVFLLGYAFRQACDFRREMHSLREETEAQALFAKEKASECQVVKAQVDRLQSDVAGLKMAGGSRGF